MTEKANEVKDQTGLCAIIWLIVLTIIIFLMIFDPSLFWKIIYK